MTPEERTEFLRTHRLAVLGVERLRRAPQLSPVYYVMDGDDLLISTTASRAKTKAVRRIGRASVCVLGEEPPFPYLSVAGPARIETERVVDIMMAVGGKMRGEPTPESARPAIEERAAREGRVVLRVTPDSYYP